MSLADLDDAKAARISPTKLRAARVLLRRYPARLDAIAVAARDPSVPTRALSSDVDKLSDPKSDMAGQDFQAIVLNHLSRNSEAFGFAVPVRVQRSQPLTRVQPDFVVADEDGTASACVSWAASHETCRTDPACAAAVACQAAGSRTVWSNVHGLSKMHMCPICADRNRTRKTRHAGMTTPHCGSCPTRTTVPPIHSHPARGQTRRRPAMRRGWHPWSGGLSGGRAASRVSPPRLTAGRAWRASCPRVPARAVARRAGHGAAVQVRMCRTGPSSHHAIPGLRPCGATGALLYAGRSR